MTAVKGMRTGGQNRKSIEALRHAGTFRSDRHARRAWAEQQEASRRSEEPPPEPPAGLSEASALLWRRILDQYIVDKAPELAMLESGLRSLDVAEAARRQIERDGLLLDGRAHPLATVHRDSRAAFLTTLRALGFPHESTP